MKSLKELREAFGWDQQKMANEIGVSESYYEKVEYGYITASQQFIRKFKKRFPFIDTNIFFTQ